MDFSAQHIYEPAAFLRPWFQSLPYGQLPGTKAQERNKTVKTKRHLVEGGGENEEALTDSFSESKAMVTTANKLTSTDI